MVWIIELLILFLLITLMVVPAVLKNPISMIHDYPKDIYIKAQELGLVKDSQNRSSKKFLIKRIVAIALLGIVFGLVVYYFNGAGSFIKGALFTYLLWAAANWYDCIVIDWIWFCHSKRVVIPGTEGMKGYKDYKFHAIGSLKGMLLGIPTALVAGIFVAILSLK